MFQTDVETYVGSVGEQGAQIRPSCPFRRSHFQVFDPQEFSELCVNAAQHVLCISESPEGSTESQNHTSMCLRLCSLHEAKS